MADFRDNTHLYDDILEKYLPFAQMLTNNLLQQAEAKQENKVFQKGMLTGFLTCQCNMIALYHPSVSEEETIKIARHITERLCQNSKIRELIRERI